jgi:hypothetical protein
VLVGDVTGGGEGPRLEGFEAADLAAQPDQEGLLLTGGEEGGLGSRYRVEKRGQVVDHPQQRVSERADCLAHVLTLGATTDTFSALRMPSPQG